MAQRRNNRGRGGSGGGNFGGNGMDVDRSSAGANSGGSYGHNNQNDDVKIEIRNWNSTNKDDLIRFIQRKTNYTPHNYRVNGNIFSFWCQRHKVSQILKLNNQQLGRQSIHVKALDNANNANGDSTSDLRTMLDTFVQSRYDPQTLLLNLSNMQGDPQLGGLLRGSATPQKVYAALFQVAGTILGPVESVSLENNGLVNVEPVHTLPDAFPDLKNLSLAGNMLSSINSILLWRNRFKLLRELVLLGNPVANQQHAVMEMFPRLVVLDGTIVRDEKTLPPPPSNKLPMPIQPRFFENEQVGKLASEFLQHFFFTWDSNRQALEPLYGDMSQFSLSVDLDSPHLPKSMGTFKAYLSQSRNIMKMSRQEVESRRLHLGANSILRAFRDMPSTKHDLHDPSAFAFDAWQLADVRAPGDAGVIVTVHGSFEDFAARKRRSFDRTFLLVPGQVPGSTLIASDMLTLRGECDNSVFQSPPPAQVAPQVAPQIAAQVPPQIPPQVPQIPPQIPPQISAIAPQIPVQNSPAELVQNLMSQTRLTAQYAEMCLSQSDFDFARALELFNVSRERLPPDAFQM